ncbi:MAG: hypothetical protein ACLPVF_06640 [Acidimicrobiales bacterium]
MNRNRTTEPPRALVLVGAGLLLFGTIVLGMLPAAAATGSTTTTAPTTSTTAPVPGSTSTTTPATSTTTTAPPSTPAGPPAASPDKETTTTTTTTTQPHGPPVTGGDVPCSDMPSGVPTATGDTCAEMPCPTGIDCGVVVAGPTSGLGPGQYVYLNFYDFLPGDTGTTIYYCSDPGASTTLTSIPTCGNTDTSSDAEAPQQVRIYPSSTSTLIPAGTSAASMQAAEVASPSTPIAGQQFNPTVPEPAGFYCDGTSANPCAIVVTDSTITPGDATSKSTNSVEIPVTFASNSTSCPNATVVSTESEFGIDLLMPEVARLSCANDPSAAVIPFETATDGLSAVTDLVSGVQQVAFTDEPEEPDQQAELAKGHFALIPVALTANVVGFFAQLNFEGNFTLDQMDLSPTMAAGLLTNAANYSGAASTDDQDACSGPSEVPPTKPGETVDNTSGPCLGPGSSPFGIGPCFGDATCSLYDQLNFINGFNQFAQYQAVQRSDNAGATGQLFNWLCNAPVVPLDFGVDPTESSSGAQELEAGLSPASGPPLTTCPAEVDQVPPINGAQRLITVNDPSQQALKANGAVFNSGTFTEASAAFTDMNWGESRYYGMNVAALQNAAGDFVTPSAASLDAAVNGATVNPDGSYNFQNLSSDPSAYPMPSMIYAVVPTTPMAPAAAASIQDLLNQLLSLTGGSNTSDLPAGFVPLPPAVYTAATADVTKDITSVQPTSTSPTTTTTTASTASTSSGGSTGSSSYSDLGSDEGELSYGSIVSAAAFDNGTSAVIAAANPGAASTGHHAVLPLLGPSLRGFALAASHGRALVPEALALGIAALLAGLFCMSAGIMRRRRALAALATAEAAGPEPPGAEP